MPNYVYHIYDEAPNEEFWLLWMLSKGDVTKHNQLYDVPLVWLYAYADRQIWENQQRGN